MEHIQEAKLFSSIREGLEQAFPPVMAQLLKELVKPAPDFADIAQVIGMDPMMSAAVLNLVNSPFYGLSQHVRSLERAAVVLGTKEILKIALSVSYLRQDPDRDQSSASFANWRLIVWAAIAAELIAERICPDQTDLAYLCTLLKDLSLLLLARVSPEMLVDSGNGPLVCLAPGQMETESRNWGRTHPALTLLALEEWGIPELGCGCIAHHHDMEGLEDHPALTQAVILATHWSELTGGCDRDPLLFMQFDLILRKRLDLTPEDFEELRLTCVQKFRSMLAILDLDEAEPDQRLYEHSVQTMQRFHFQTADILSASGGVVSVARCVARHLAWNFEVGDWQLALRSPISESWALFASGDDVPSEALATAETDAELPWKFKKYRLMLLASGEKWGELRLAPGLPEQDVHQVALYVRFLSRAYEQYCMRQAVLESKARTLDQLPVGVARLDGAGRILELNTALFQLLNAPESPRGRDVLDCMAALGDLGAEDEWRGFLADRCKLGFTKIACAPAAGRVHRCLFISAHKAPAPGGILFMAEDLSEVSALELQAFEHSEFLESLVGSMQELVLTVAPDGTVTYAPPGQRERLLGENLFRLTRPTKSSAASWAPGRLQATETPLEVAFMQPDGSYAPMECVITPLRGRRESASFLLVGRDLGKVRRLEEKIKRQAVYDGLTNLFNHHQFHALLEREVRRAQRTGHPMGLIFIDLDEFKQVNDTEGHQAGDAVLRKVAAALREQVRQGTDFPCRYGGDEFALIAAETGPAGLESLASRVKAAADASLLGRIRMSIGLAMLKQGEGAQSLLKRADNACYEAKRGGGDTIAKA